MNGVREPCLSAPPVQRADPPELAIVATPIGETGAEEATTSDWAPGYAAPSAAGGLLFLVPLIERLGFGEWWAAAAPRKLRAPGALAGQVFHLLLARLGTGIRRAASVAKRDEWSWFQGVVNPRRLFTTTCTVPPTV